MDGDHAAILGHFDDAVEIEIRAGIFAKEQELAGAGSCGRGFIHVGGGHDGHGLEHLRDGAADAARRNATVGNQNRLALDFLQNLLERLRSHGQIGPP